MPRFPPRLDKTLLIPGRGNLCNKHHSKAGKIQCALCVVKSHKVLRCNCPTGHRREISLRSGDHFSLFPGGRRKASNLRLLLPPSLSHLSLLLDATVASLVASPCEQTELDRTIIRGANLANRD